MHINRNGHYDRELRAHVYTWRDPDRTLVGFVYQYEDNTARVVYFSPVHYSYGIHVHTTTARRVPDDAQFGGWRLETMPDPETDPTINTFEVPFDEV